MRAYLKLLLIVSDLHFETKASRMWLSVSLIVSSILLVWVAPFSLSLPDYDIGELARQARAEVAASLGQITISATSQKRQNRKITKE